MVTRNTNFALNSLMEELVNNNFLLFGSSVNNYSSNTPDSFSAAVSNPVFAANIQKKNLKKVQL